MVNGTVNSMEADHADADGASNVPDLAFNGVREQFLQAGVSPELLAGDLIFMDTETTGFDNEADAIIEIGAVRYTNGRYTGQYHKYFNPNMPIPDESAKVHGITNELMQEMIRNGQAKTFSRSEAARLARFLGDAVILGHNFVRFDAKFLKSTYARHGVSWVSNRVIDTMTISKVRFPRNKLNLDALCKLMKVNTEGRKEFHGALVDAEITARMFAALVSLPPTGDLFASLRPEQSAMEALGPVRIISDRGRPSSSDIMRHNALCERLGIEWR